MTIVTPVRGHPPPYLEANAAPGQDSDGARHGEPKLDKVASIMITFNEGTHVRRTSKMFFELVKVQEYYFSIFNHNKFSK